MKWADRIFGGTLGPVAAGVAGVAVGAAVRAVLDSTLTAPPRADSLTARFGEPVLQDGVETRFGRALALQLDIQPHHVVPDDAQLAVRLSIGPKYIQSALPEFADNEGRFLAVTGVIRPEKDVVLAGCLIPYSALPLGHPSTITAAVLLVGGGKPLAAERFDLCLTPQAV
jgi:hypothetical protein